MWKRLCQTRVRRVEGQPGKQPHLGWVWGQTCWARSISCLFTQAQHSQLSDEVSAQWEPQVCNPTARYLTRRYWLLKGFLPFCRKQLNKEAAVLVNVHLSRLQPCLWCPSFLSPGILYTNKMQGLNFPHFIHCPCHGYPSYGYCYCFHPLLSLPKPLFLFLPLIFLLLWDAYCLSYFSPAV